MASRTTREAERQEAAETAANRKRFQRLCTRIKEVVVDFADVSVDATYGEIGVTISGNSVVNLRVMQKLAEIFGTDDISLTPYVPEHRYSEDTVDGAEPAVLRIVGVKYGVE